MTNKIPSYWKNCATCTHWCGWTSVDFFCNNVEFEVNGFGRCAGGGFRGVDTPALGTCHMWNKRY